MPFLVNKRFLLVSLIAASSISIAQAQPATQGVTFSPSAGYYKMDRDRSVDSSAALSFGIGYQFNNPWAVELVYVRVDTDASSVDKSDVDVNQYRLDGLYHLASIGKLTPYFAAGVGTVDFSPDRPNNGLVNAGGGIKYALNDIVSARADYRLINDFKDKDFDQIATIGLHFLFGSQSKNTDSPVTAVKAAPMPIAQPIIAPKQIDTDNDGVIDANDRCPNTPAGIAVDANGCALDDDQDGVPNYLDKCPNTLAGFSVDAKGCYLALTAAQSIDLNIQFATNSAEVNPEYAAKIKTVAAYLKEYPETLILVEGHTDSAGATPYNQALSTQRAQAIANKLILEEGINKNRVSAIGYGSEKPLMGNDTEAERQANRRVIAVISLNKNYVPAKNSQVKK